MYRLYIIYVHCIICTGILYNMYIIIFKIYIKICKSLENSFQLLSLSPLFVGVYLQKIKHNRNCPLLLFSYQLPLSLEV